LRIQVALALGNKAVVLYQLGHKEEAQSVHDDMVTRFGEDALAGFDEFARRYAKANGQDDDNTNIQTIIADAREVREKILEEQSD
jgi:L-rhamnose isomerase